MKRRRRRSETGATGNGTEMGAADEDDILARNFGQMSPYVCREALLARFEKLVNQLASGWKYHISNTEGIKQAWLQFEDFYSNVCSYTSASRQTTAQAHGIETEDIGDGDTYDEEYRISTAEYFDAIVNAGLPGPLQLPTVPAAPDEEAEELVPMSSSSSWLRNVVVNSEPAADEQALVGPPTNVRVQATSNSSAVVQWDFEEGGPDGGVADGFVIKYIHEPVNGQSDSERWRSQVVMDSKARHLEIAQLTVHKPYAFCVLAIKQKRQGQCSDPPITIENLQPVHMVSNLHVHTKTSNQVELAWDYSGPQNIQFYIKQTGSKKYIDQHLEEKEMVAPGYHKEANEHDRRLVWDNLRPYMEYRFQVGVRDLSGGTEFWPREVTVRTDSAGPPFVDKPEFIESRTSETALLKLRCASEEYGPISHYWLIVVPGNFTQEDMVKLTSSKADMLTRATALKRPLSDAGDDIGVVAKKKMRTTEGVTIRSKTKRYSSDTPSLDGVYIAAGLSASEMQQMTRNNRNFVLGDGKTYDGYRNHPLEPNSKYRLMMRAFARQERSDQPFKYARPMHEPPSPKYTDSTLSDIFSTKSSPMTRGARSSNIWLLGPIIAVVVILIIVGMLVFWWLRGKKKGIPHGANRHGSITKVALGGINNGMPTETSKLLLGTDAYGRPVMNPYEMSNGGNMGRDNIDMYPMGNGISNYPPVPVPMMSSSGAGIGSHAYVHPPIPISELPAHIDKLKMNNNALFSQEYESIETGQHFTWEHSSMEMNKAKNRYANVVAYDHSRVILSSIDDIPGSDYINANYIDGYERTKTYIATQGPLPETFADFWRMVWEERSATIVMLTKLEERSRIKCDQYWPSRNSSVYGRIQVTLVDTLTLAHYTIRTFTIEHRDEKECREIKHLQYTAWPDHGVPDHPTPFLMFLKRVRTLNDPEAGPIISHCSAGIGRTGAFIVIDCMLERLRYESTVDIFGCVTSLRSQRSYMVQTDDQYVFIHDAVLDAVQSGSTEVPASKLFGHIQMLHQHQNYDRVSGLELEFRTLGTLRNLNSRCDVGNLPINRPKNRTAMIVPFDTTRVVLQMIPTVEGSDYINASWIDGYTQRNAYIGTQAPLPNTVSDFWRMVWEQESSIIAMLNSSNEFGTGRHQEMFCQYWPSESSSKFGSIVVEPVAEYNMTQYVLREFKMTDTLTGYSRTVRHFEFTEWPDHGVPTSGEVFIDFINQVHRTKQQFGVDGPICVHCTTGTGRTGVFIALSIIIERMQLEQVVDVFTTVKLLRTERMNMVDDSAQYEFCYQAAGDFLKLNAFDSPYLMQ
ncbi:hypothetical protein QR680_001181 [Steinernema hermaphroditum]|uniref:protein-tyrosine-phosphatase n=1 Tax=Steinernema hermaphroditum TaxID=289476 RepID=A0AA39LFD7_9BILA|nr:hypothetical protein QR680_001181 [Steinernema hermaphroditum]